MSRIKIVRHLIIPLLFFFMFGIRELQAKSVYQKQIKNNEIEIEADAYYTSFDYYLSITNTAIPYYDNADEFNIYKKLLADPTPRYLVFELSSYPLPCIGALLKKQTPDFYESMNVTDNFNIIKSITAGFEEPYAISLFLGNVISFKQKDTKDMEGKGYTGFLLSAGNYHIKDNEIIADNWLETELKIKGDKKILENKMSWSFRVGAKFHNNDYIKDVLYFSIRRDRTDKDKLNRSPFRNSNIEYTFDLGTKKTGILRHYFLVGKKIPFNKPKVVVSFGAGFLWEKSDKYTGPLERTGEINNFQILFRPNIEF
ncbi:MAG: hypothetical protein HY919_07465 [Elusimicrobia bacterium]|nr:hypothetical protein [Elusimicrobiota bacterium]